MVYIKFDIFHIYGTKNKPENKGSKSLTHTIKKQKLLPKLGKIPKKIFVVVATFG